MIYFAAIIYLLGGLSYYDSLCDMANIDENINKISQVTTQYLDELPIVSLGTTQKFMWLILLVWPILVVVGKCMRIYGWLKG